MVSLNYSSERSYTSDIGHISEALSVFEKLYAGVAHTAGYSDIFAGNP